MAAEDSVVAMGAAAGPATAGISPPAARLPRVRVPGAGLWGAGEGGVGFLIRSAPSMWGVTPIQHFPSVGTRWAHVSGCSTGP